jgi:MFS family permease
MPQTFHRDRFTWLIYLFLAFYGYCLNVLGPITPFLKDELGLSYTVSSLHFTAFAVGILLVGLGGHVPIRRLGRWRSLWIGAAGMSLGALLLAAGRTPVITIGAAFLMGAIGSLILALVPSVLSDRHGELRVMLGRLADAVGIRSAYGVVALLLLGVFLIIQFAGASHPAQPS